MTFQKNVLRIAFVLLIITSIIVFIMLYFSKNQYDFPPNVSNCPDYWEINGPTIEGDPYECVNKANIGSGTYTFNGINNGALVPTTAEKLCDLKRDLNGNGILWTGLSNNPAICNVVDNIE